MNLNASIKLPPGSAALLRMAVRTQFAHWAAAVIVSLAVAVTVVVLPLTRHLRVLHERVEKVQVKMEKVEGISRGARDFNRILDELSDEFRELKTQVLQPGEQAKVISLLTQTAEDLNITILSMNPILKKETAEAGEEKKIRPALFEVEMSCHYKTLGVFFERLTAAPLILTVEGFDARPEVPNAPVLNVRLLVAAYVEWL
ncbi:MAG: hypothetical protein Q8R76_12730 [Candidatus Omnitrophota bacterium]|nr:hypothetical protein [Candidatus Omnitrophota bacterium]